MSAMSALASWPLALLTAILRVGLGGLFVYTGLLKLPDAHAMATSIADYHLVPQGLVGLLAVSLPSIEIVAGGLLALGIWRRGAALLVGGMLLVFTVALVQAAARGIDINCGCFGAASERIGWSPIARDLGLLAVAVVAYLADDGRLAVGRFAGWLQ